VKRLEQKSLLPAIFFIFSRAGCEQAAETVCQFMRGPRDVFDCDVDDFDDDDTNNGQTIFPPQRKRTSRQRGKHQQENSGILEDSKGRSFRRGSNYVSDDVLASVFEQEITKRGTESYQSDSPLSSDNWDFYSNAGLLRRSEVEEVAGRVASFNENNK
jgi:hypothetical protein